MWTFGLRETAKDERKHNLWVFEWQEVQWIVAGGI
jgi:hypothetical protein